MSVSLRIAMTLPLLCWLGGMGAPSRPVAIAGFRGAGDAAHRAALIRCRAAKDQVVQALEHLRADSNAADLADANEYLKRALDMCADSGEAWYYQSLVEAKLGHTRLAEAALDNAKTFPSEALTERLNPFVLAVPKGAPPPPPVRQKWALVIGIGTFGDASIPHLRYTRGDAEAFREVLVDPALGGFPAANVEMLTDDKATLRAIKEKLNWLARSAQPDDLAVVYVASHGSPRDLDTAGANYILTSDTEVGAGRNPDTLYATALPMVELANAVATRLQAQRTAVFLDTCYSGTVAAAGGKAASPRVASAGVSQNTLRQMDQGAGRVIVAASRTDQESLESETLGHGYFTYYLVTALKQHPGMPLSQIFAMVRDQVSAQVAKDYRTSGLHQTPVMSRSAETTDFALGRPAEIAAVRITRP